MSKAPMIFTTEAVSAALVSDFYAPSRRIMSANNDQEKPMCKYEKSGVADEVQFVAQALADAHWKEPGSDPSGWMDTAFNMIVAIRAMDAFAVLPVGAVEEPAGGTIEAEDPVMAPEGGKTKRGKPKLVSVEELAAE